MKVSCAVPREMATPNLAERLREIGVQPIVTDYVIRAVYEGPNCGLGEAIMDMFSREVDHEVSVFYTEKELEQFTQPADMRRSSRRKKKNRNA